MYILVKYVYHFNRRRSIEPAPKKPTERSNKRKKSIKRRETSTRVHQLSRRQFLEELNNRITHLLQPRLLERIMAGILQDHSLDRDLCDLGQEQLTQMQRPLSSRGAGVAADE